jgi:hypothetical protein
VGHWQPKKGVGNASSRSEKRHQTSPSVRAHQEERKGSEQLYNDAKKLGIEGRSKMSKSQLQRAVAGAES